MDIDFFSSFLKCKTKPSTSFFLSFFPLPLKILFSRKKHNHYPWRKEWPLYHKKRVFPILSPSINLKKVIANHLRKICQLTRNDSNILTMESRHTMYLIHTYFFNKNRENSIELLVFKLIIHQTLEKTSQPLQH